MSGALRRSKSGPPSDQVKAITERTVVVFVVLLMLPLVSTAPEVSLRLPAIWERTVPLVAVVNETGDPCWQVGGGAFFVARGALHAANKAVVHRAMTRRTKRASVFMRAILPPRSGNIKRDNGRVLANCHNSVTLEGNSGGIVYVI